LVFTYPGPFWRAGTQVQSQAPILQIPRLRGQIAPSKVVSSAWNKASETSAAASWWFNMGQGFGDCGKSCRRILSWCKSVGSVFGIQAGGSGRI
jgi:hypothetical protein